jgi:hypothetical protein
MCNEQWPSRIVHQIHDPREWGRFVGFTFRVRKDTFLSIITAYRCVTKCSKDSGNKTSVHYQREQIKKLGLTASVRNLCLQDLSLVIQKLKSKFGEDSGVILMIDANETISESNSQLPDFCGLFN